MDDLLRRPPSFTPSGIAYRHFGAGMPLVLFHGGTGSYTHWVRNIPVLAQIRSVVAFDLPGFGDSASVRDDISIEEYVATVVHETKSVVGATADIVGFSFGGLIAAGVACAPQFTPRRLSLLAPSGFEKPVGRILGRKHRSELTGDDLKARREFYKHNLLAMMLAHEKTIEDATIDLHMQNIAKARLKHRHLTWSNKVVDFIAATQCPMQIIFGDRDTTAYPSIEARIQRCLDTQKPIRVDMIHDAGHWVQYERPAEVNRLLFEFLA